MLTQLRWFGLGLIPWAIVVSLLATRSIPGVAVGGALGLVLFILALIRTKQNIYPWLRERAPAGAYNIEPMAFIMALFGLIFPVAGTGYAIYITGCWMEESWKKR